jgi:hypothetical protein
MEAAGMDTCTADPAIAACGDGGADSTDPSAAAEFAAAADPADLADPAAARLDGQAVASFLDCIDVLVDGPFMQDKKSLSLDFCGSANQRLIDVKKTRQAGKICLWSPEKYDLVIPDNW